MDVIAGSIALRKRIRNFDNSYLTYKGETCFHCEKEMALKQKRDCPFETVSFL